MIWLPKLALNFLSGLEVAAEEVTLDGAVTQIIGFLTSKVSLTMVITAIGVIIGAIAVPIFVWKFGRKGFNAIKRALQGKNAGV